MPSAVLASLATVSTPLVLRCCLTSQVTLFNTTFRPFWRLRSWRRVQVPKGLGAALADMLAFVQHGLRSTGRTCRKSFTRGPLYSGAVEASAVDDCAPEGSAHESRLVLGQICPMDSLVLVCRMYTVGSSACGAWGVGTQCTVGGERSNCRPSPSQQLNGCDRDAVGRQEQENGDQVFGNSTSAVLALAISVSLIMNQHATTRTSAMWATFCMSKASM